MYDRSVCGLWLHQSIWPLFFPKSKRKLICLKVWQDKHALGSALMMMKQCNNINNICVYSPNWIRLYGEEHHCSEYLLIGKQSNDLPEFGKIVDICVIVNYVLVCVKRFETVGLCNHLMCYRIEPTLRQSVIPLSRILHRHPLTSHTYTDQHLYIALRSHVEL